MPNGLLLLPRNRLLVIVTALDLRIILVIDLLLIIVPLLAKTVIADINFLGFYSLIVFIEGTCFAFLNQMNCS